MKIERTGYKVYPLKTLLTTSVKNGYSPVCPEAESGNWVLGLGALNGNGLDLSQKKPAPPNDQKIQNFLLSKGDFLVSRSNTLDKVGRASLFRGEVDNCAYPDLMMRFRVDEKKVNLEYLDTYLRTENIRHYFQIHAAGSSGSMVKITKSILEEAPILLPPLPEQEKIASFLGAVDTRLNQLRRKRELLQTYKRGIMQKLFSQQIRFTQPDGSPFPDWETDRIDNFLVRYSDPVDVQLDAKYKQIGIRSHGKGVFHKDPVTGKDLGNKRVYWVHPKSFVVNIVFAWEQAVALTSSQEEGYIASHRFLMFLPKESRVNLEFILLFFLGSRGKSLLELASPGGAGRNKTLGQQNFSELKVTFPTVKEQEKIANFLITIDRKIEIFSYQIEQTEQFKKGLLQKLFV